MLLEKASKMPTCFALRVRLTAPSSVSVRPSCRRSAALSTTTTPAIISCKISQLVGTYSQPHHVSASTHTFSSAQLWVHCKKKIICTENSMFPDRRKNIVGTYLTQLQKYYIRNYTNDVESIVLVQYLLKVLKILGNNNRPARTQTYPFMIYFASSFEANTQVCSHFQSIQHFVENSRSCFQLFFRCFTTWSQHGAQKLLYSECTTTSPT